MIYLAYTALYRKFRPMTFSEMVGQEHIKQTLKNQVIANRVGHAYLFNGGRGTGKTSAAKILARAINCLNPKDGEPCNKCEICIGAIDGSLTDIVEMDAASNNSVDDVREIREAVNFLPTKAKYRVYIIDEVHMLSTGAFNALLKTLEEPPEHVKFILATTEPQKIPATILSRCQRFDFKRISNEDIIKRLKIVTSESKIEITDGALNLIATLAEGAMRDALSILERCNQDGNDKIDENKVRDLVGIPKITYINKIVRGVIEKDVSGTLETVQNVIDEGKDLNNLIWEIVKYVKDILLFKSTDKLELYSNNEIEDIKSISDNVSKEELINLITTLSEVQNDVKISTQKVIVFETGLIKLCSRNDNINIKDINSNNNTNNKELEERVRKLENFLRAGNFVKKVENNIKPNNKNIMEKAKEVNQQKPKYTGKTQDYWPKLINEFKQEGKMFMYINLSGTVAKEINDMTIAIEFPNGINKMAREFLERPENKMELKNTIHRACGKEMQIKFVDNMDLSEEDNVSEFENLVNNNNLNFNIIE